MSPELAVKSETVKKPRGSQVRFPRYSLADSVAVAEAVHKQGGGLASRDRLAAFLNYSSTNNGAFLNRLAAARLFGTITNSGSDFVITPLAQKILMPVYQEQTQEGLVEAVFNVPLFKQVYDEHVGRELPPEFGMKNLFKSKYGMDAGQAEIAYRTLMESAETAGFFATRGTRTHLIVPQMRKSGQASTDSAQREGDGATGIALPGGGDGGSGRPPTLLTPATKDDLRAAYVSALIDMLREKAKSGETDTELMEKIESLIEKM